MVVSSGIDVVDRVTVDRSGSVNDDGTEVPFHGTRIKLFDGCVLCWCGIEIHHETAQIANKQQACKNQTYSAHWCSSAKQHTLAVHLAKAKKSKEAKTKHGKDNQNKK